ncbi:MAG: outer membrane protein assembly factor BamD [Candidatus Rokubacteria bacterium]|nr:outer membrane protein assembly factor BamD [Candidatus Rokubacteria bacterium]MBI4593662.1 outer membrane protein assembly factor BamD [Candidatus Rokubacteria bacterium]
MSRATAGTAHRLLAAALLLGGCAGVAEVTGTASQQDLVQLRADVAALGTSIRQIKTQLDTLSPQVDGRLREQAAESERRAAALTARLEGLATTVTRLTARMDELSARLEALNRQSRVSPPARPAPGPAPGQPAAPPAAPAPAPAAPAGSRPSTGSLQPQDLYQAAYIDFSKGTYALAIAGFREFLRRYPGTDLSDNAQYWIGEAYLAMARGHADGGRPDQATQALQQAVQEFKKVIANYPRGDKAPTALYKEALALIELQQPQLAQQRLQYLIDNFPQAEETPLARERLAALKER